MTNKLRNIFASTVLLISVVANVQAATVVLATQPLITASTTAVSPNVFLMMDDSGSMAWSHMPDDSGDGGSSVPLTYGYYGFRSSQCNGVFYNPAITYVPPVDYTGASYSNASFTGAWVDGYHTGSGTVNLSSSFKATDSSSIQNQDSTGQAAYYYRYTGSQTKKTYYDNTSTFFKECSSAQSATTYGSSVFTKVVVSSTSGLGGTDERVNFANWYSYYRTRMLMMKTSTGLAFKPLGSSYRVGFATMNNNGGADFLNLATFDSTQKQSWYTKLYNASAGDSTPLLGALSKVGRMYANKLSTLNGVAVTDPIQYSCQQNFTVLTTDGFWNDATNSNLSGSSVGNQDGTELRPMLDGSSQVSTATTPTTTAINKQLDKNNTVVTTYKSHYYSAGGAGADGCTSSKKRLHDKLLTCVKTTVTPMTATQLETTVVNSVVVTTNGVAGAPSTSTTTTYNPTTPSYTNGTSADSYAPAGCNPASPSVASWANGSDAATGSCTSSLTLPSPNPSSVSSSLTSNTTTSAVATVLSNSGPTVGATTVVTTSSGGTSNTLADVAEYYYKTDLRDASLSNATGVLGNDVAQNNVPASGLDGASWQHMTTFTLGLGAPGKMEFVANYATATTGDFYAVKTGATASSTVCTWKTAGLPCTWPTPSATGIPENIDDLWHAAINGRGTYFSATNPAELTTGLSSALSGVTARLGAAAAATTSNPNVTAGDNFVFESSFISGDWTGELVRRTLSLTTGVPSTTADWAARDKLDAQATRTLYTYSNSGANHLKPFAWLNLSGTEQAYFLAPYISSLSQFCASGATCLSAADQAAAAGANLVAYLSGDTTNAATYYRARPHRLGDVVNAEAAYVRAPIYSYADAGHADFRTSASITGRAGMVYLAANDGMLHALVAGDATITPGDGSGSESWAYVPGSVLPNLYKLADANYRNQHQFILDGTPVVGDICASPPCTGAQWKTILVAGMNAGGRGYYALDVTNPSAPQALWEFTDPNLGYTYGNPEIVKLNDGTWVVLVASGYNNVLPGDGVGRLYVLNANTGAVIRTISTGVGSTGTPSGLARIRAWLVDGNTDNTALRVYGGDLFGNVWRFDINGDVGAAGYEAQLLVTLKDPTGTPQPITSRPTIDDCNGTPMVMVGTGQYLGSPDVANHQQQSVYGIKDTLAATTFNNPQAGGSGFQQQTLTAGTCPAGAPSSVCVLGQTVRTSTSNVVNLATQNGWYLNFLDAGERDNTDPTVVFDTLVMNTNVPDVSACNVGGYSYTYTLNSCTGVPVPTAYGVVAVSLGNAIATRPVVIALPNNSIVALHRMSNGDTLLTNPGAPPPTTGTRRVSWRELVNDR